MKRYWKIFFITLIVLTLGLLAPYLFIGKYWGMQWFQLTIPFSTIFEKTFGISEDTPLLILLCTVLQGSWISLIFASIYCKLIKGKKAEQSD